MIVKAALFAQQRHKNQKRKYGGEPYFVHLEEVAYIVAQYEGSEEMICAAYLHDVIEDTETSYDEIELEFGKIVADLVWELTDKSKPSDGNRKIRKEIDRENLRIASAAAQTIKLADLISNSKDIVEKDKKFAKVYLNEKKLLLEVLTKGNRDLHERASAMIEKSLQALVQKLVK